MEILGYGTVVKVSYRYRYQGWATAVGVPEVVYCSCGNGVGCWGWGIRVVFFGAIANFLVILNILCFAFPTWRSSRCGFACAVLLNNSRRGG